MQTVPARPIPRAPAKSRTYLFWLYVTVLLAEFKWTLVTLGSVVVVGAGVYGVSPEQALGGSPPGLTKALYSAWMALLAQPVYQSPEAWYLQLLQALYPLIGFVLLGEGIVRLALLLMSKRHGEKEWMKVMASTYRDHVILCGLGHLGFRVLEQVLSHGSPVVALEKDGDGRFVGEAKALGVPVLIRNMKDDESLVEAGIIHARTIIIATNDDLANLEVALDARRMNPSIRVVMRLFDQRIATKLSGVMAVDAAFSTAALAAPMVAAMCLETRVLSSHLVDGVSYVVADCAVGAGSSLVGGGLGELERNYRARVLKCSGAAPSDSAEVRGGDLLLVHVAAGDLPALLKAAQG